MALLKLRVPSKRSSNQFEIFRMHLNDPINEESFKKLIERIESITGVCSGQTIISWNDGSDDCSIRNVTDLQDAIHFHKPGSGRSECILLKIQISETVESNHNLSTDKNPNIPNTTTLTKKEDVTKPNTVVTTMNTVPSCSIPDSDVSNHIVTTTGSIISPPSPAVHLPTYVQAACFNYDFLADPPAYSDVTCPKTEAVISNESNPVTRTRDSNNESSLTKYARVAQKPTSGSCPNLFKPPSSRPPLFFHPVSLGLHSASSEKSLKKSKKNRPKQIQSQSQRQSSSRSNQQSPLQKQCQIGRSGICLSDERVVEIETQLQEMGFHHDRSVMEQAIRSCEGDFNRIVDKLGCI